jgi:MFS family permease
MSDTTLASGPRRIWNSLFYRQGESIFAVLRADDFRNLWIGQMISFVGDALAYNTMTLGILRMANEEGISAGKILSVLFVLSALPSLFLGMVAGTLADRYNRKHIMIAADIIRGFLTLGFLLVNDISQIWIYVAISIALSTVSVFFFPARTALLPQMLEREQLLSANAMAQLTHTLAFVVGAALAGAMVGLSDATAPAFLGDSLSFFISAFFIARIRISGNVERAAQYASQTARPAVGALAALVENVRTMMGELWVGLRYVLTDQVMRGVLISFLAMMLGLGAANVTFVPLLINELGMQEEGLGLIRGSQTLGIVLGSAAISSLALRYKARDLIGMSMLIFGVTTVIVSVVENYAVMVGVLFLVGLVISPPQIVASTLMQRHVPGDKLGRASGAQGTIVNVANIASMGAAGYLMDEIGARDVFALAGILIFVAGIVSWAVLRGVEDSPAAMHQPSEEQETYETRIEELAPEA